MDKNNFVKDTKSYYKEVKNSRSDRLEVEIGDSKEPNKVLPQVKIKRWDNECNVSIRLVNETENFVFTENNGKIRCKGEKVSVDFYEIEEGFETEVVLHERPNNNAITFTLLNKDVEYLYQPELTQEERDLGHYRPENVIGSYAVYSKTLKHNVVGGKEYKTGKVGHIYRPKIRDSNGKEIWGILNINNGLLTITIPQDFLENALYPVYVDPTFGYTTAGSSVMSDIGANIMFLSLYTTDTAGSINFISAYVGDSGNFYSGSFKFVLVDGIAKTIVTNGITPVGSTAVGVRWLTIPYTTKPSVTASTNYYLGLITSSSSRMEFYYDASGSSGQDNSNDYTTPTDPTDMSTNTYKYSIYAVYGLSEFGKTTTGTNVQTFSGDRCYVCSATPTTGGTVHYGMGMVRVTSASTSEARMVIYADNGGQPGDFLAESDEVIVNWTTSVMTIFPFSGAAQITLVANTNYWVGFRFDDPGTPSFEMQRDNTAGLVHYMSMTYPGDATDPFVSAGTAAGPLNASILYLESTTTIQIKRRILAV